jgi:hypothetical protein
MPRRNKPDDHARQEPATTESHNADLLKDHVEQIHRLGKRVLEDVIEIGRRLAACRVIVGHGDWLAWVDRELGWSDRTVERFISVFDLSSQSKFDNLSNLEIPLSGFYLLAAPSTPPEAVDQIVSSAKAGNRPTHDDIRQTIARAKDGTTRLEESKSRRSSPVPGVAAAPHAERGNDLYETPPAAVRALLEVEKLTGTIWEPACGPGAIVGVLRAAGHRVVATDLIDYGCPDSRGGIDFLTTTSLPDGVTTILTNPPYRHANAFVRHALKLAPRRIIMLFPLRYLETTGRSDILDSGKLARVYVFRNRLAMMHRARWEGPIASSQLAFAWFVWDREHSGDATLHRISWREDDKAPVSANGDLAIPPFLRRAKVVP